MKCDRCNSITHTISMSWFNKEMVCVKCKEIERNHPDFKRAKEMELKEVRKGNMNYSGIGLPDGYDKWVEEQQ